MFYETWANMDENYYDSEFHGADWFKLKEQYAKLLPYLKTGKSIAYIHMKDMGSQSLNKFVVEMTNEAHYRDGLILDLRYNTGGNVHDDVLKFLSQRPYLLWKYRGGKFTQQPNFSPSAKPIVRRR